MVAIHQIKPMLPDSRVDLPGARQFKIVEVEILKGGPNLSQVCNKSHSILFRSRDEAFPCMREHFNSV